MGEFDWIDINNPEHQRFLITSANDLAERVKKANALYQKYEEQADYIKVLEDQVKLLQKTLDVVNKNMVLTERMVRCGRKKDVRKNNNR